MLALLEGPAPAIPRLGIKPYQWGTECLSGDVLAGPATSFPQAIGMVLTLNFNICNPCNGIITFMDLKRNSIIHNL